MIGAVVFTGVGLPLIVTAIAGSAVYTQIYIYQYINISMFLFLSQFRFHVNVSLYMKRRRGWVDPHP